MSNFLEKFVRVIVLSNFIGNLLHPYLKMDVVAPRKMFLLFEVQFQSVSLEQFSILFLTSFLLSNSG